MVQIMLGLYIVLIPEKPSVFKLNFWQFFFIVNFGTARYTAALINVSPFCLIIHCGVGGADDIFHWLPTDVSDYTCFHMADNSLLHLTFYQWNLQTLWKW